MPTCVHAVSVQAGGDSSPLAHQDNVAPSGIVSSEWFALAHQPISLQQAKQIPHAVKALDDEWTKLQNRCTWSLDTAREKKDVKEEATAKNEETHFGELMTLCFLKGAELEAKHQ
eukprot:2520095-Karenia_brevis.AAC.1